MATVVYRDPYFRCRVGLRSARARLPVATFMDFLVLVDWYDVGDPRCGAHDVRHEFEDAQVDLLLELLADCLS